MDTHARPSRRSALRAAALLLLSGLGVAPVPALAQEWGWADRAGGSLDDWPVAVAVDVAGNAYVTGHFRGTAEFGGVSLTSAGESDVFVVKYAPNGTVAWARRAGGPYHDAGYGIAVDEAGNAYVTGYFTATADFGNSTLTSTGGADAFVTSYAPDGTIAWARRSGGPSDDAGFEITVDQAGYGFVVGHFQHSADVGPYTLTSAGSWDASVAKYDPDGTVVWAQRAGGSGSDAAFGVAVGDAGQVAVTGSFEGAAGFGGFTLSSAGASDVFVVRYGTEGSVTWARGAGGPGYDAAWGIAVDAAGSAYVTGQFQRTADFGPWTIASAGRTDAFIAKYGPEGTVSWAQRAGGQEFDQAYGVAVGAAGHAFVTGVFQGTAHFGPVAVTSAGSYDVFVATYSPEGAILWADGAGGPFPDSGTAIAADYTGGAVVTGSFLGTATFGSFTLASAGVSDVFLARLSAVPVRSEPPLEDLDPGYILAVRPNPVVDRAWLSFRLRDVGHATLALHDAAGRRLRTLYEGSAPAGQAVEVEMGVSDLSAGTYTIRLLADGLTATQPLTVLR